ncbi:transmembrane transport [Mactra antiquata]
MSQKTFPHKTKPDIDRGWAWVVMIAAYLGTILQGTSLFTGGVIHIALLNKFKEGQAKTSLVGALNSGLLCFACPLGGAINNRFSCRVTIVTGAIISTLGFTLSAFMPNLDWLIFTAGTLVGIGHGLIVAGINCVVALYFEKRRDTVLASIVLAASFGMFLGAPLGLYVINNCGLSSTFLFLACLQAQLCIVGVICKPSVIENKFLSKMKINRAGQSSVTCLDMSMLNNISYLGFLCSSVTWNFALGAVLVHLPYCVTVFGGSNSEIAYIMTSLTVANVVGRLLGVLTVSRFHPRGLHVHVLMTAVCGICSILFPFYSNLRGGLYIFGIQIGLLLGWPNSMMTSLSLSFVSVDKLSESTSLVFLFCGIGVVSGPILTGYLYSTTRSYQYSFLASGVFLIIGSALGILSLCNKQKTRKKESTIETIVTEKDCQNQLKEPPEQNSLL